MSGEKEKRGGVAFGNPSIFFLEPQGVLSFPKRKKGLVKRKRKWQIASGQSAETN